jgi:hypothetical protein
VEEIKSLWRKFITWLRTEHFYKEYRYIWVLLIGIAIGATSWKWVLALVFLAFVAKLYGTLDMYNNRQDESEQEEKYPTIKHEDDILPK